MVDDTEPTVSVYACGLALVACASGNVIFETFSIVYEKLRSVGAVVSAVYAPANNASALFDVVAIDRFPATLATVPDAKRKYNVV